MNKVLQNGESFYFKVTKNKTITAAKLISLMKGNRLNNQQNLKCALILFVHVMLLEKDPSKKVWIYDAFPHLGRYASKSLDSPLLISRLLRWHTLKYDNIMEGDPFKYKENNTMVVDEDEDLGGHHYVPIPPRPCDHAGSSGLKPSPDASNDDDLHESVALLEKSLLDITSSVRDERLRRIEKNKKRNKKKVN
ncbi:hypothetical protein FXO38_13574 [Capsicum annuum]|nr:hypothetical protein FXO38_13574 [Capsicum annuum]KAF3657957.1 hypothetical protein FXO37_14639 [Capsicum annuum]